MQLFGVNNKGEIVKLNKLDFQEGDIYLVDDDKTIYVWEGLKASLYQKDIATKKARSLNNERGGTVKIQLLDQNQEYGAFLAMMDNLKRGVQMEGTIERRNELKLEEPKDLSETEKWLIQLKKYRKEEPEKKRKPERDEELREHIKVAAYFLSKSYLSYDDLCWLLAEKQMVIQKGYDNVTENDIRKKAEEVYRSSSTYDELCWLNAKLDVLREKGYFEIT